MLVKVWGVWKPAGVATVDLRSECKIWSIAFHIYENKYWEYSTSTNLWLIYSEGFFYYFFSTFFNVDPIAVAYNLNPSAEQHLPSIGKYKD